MDTRVSSNQFPGADETHSLKLAESSSLEGFSINQVQCFTESALRTPSWRSSWGSCSPGCLCATRGGTPRWERLSADSWAIWGWHPWLGHTAPPRHLGLIAAKRPDANQQLNLHLLLHWGPKRGLVMMCQPLIYNPALHLMKLNDFYSLPHSCCICPLPRLTKHKGVNLTDIGPNYTDGFIQITSEQKSNLENMWQLRWGARGSKENCGYSSVNYSSLVTSFVFI